MKRGEFEADDVVVLPTGKRAVVLRRMLDEENRVEMRYLSGGVHDLITLPSRLVRLVRAGMDTPPVRLPGVRKPGTKVRR